MQLEPTHFGSDRAAGVDRARNLAGVSYPADCGTTTRIKNIEFYEASYDNNREKPLQLLLLLVKTMVPSSKEVKAHSQLTDQFMLQRLRGPRKRTLIPRARRFARRARRKSRQEARL